MTIRSSDLGKYLITFSERRICMNSDFKFRPGPFRNDEEKEDIKSYPRRKIQRPINHSLNQREIVDYFERRLKRLQIVKTTTTPRGQIIDWIPIESQHPKGEIASPPPANFLPPWQKEPSADQPELIVVGELERKGVKRGPKGTVPILRKRLQELGYTKSLKNYLSKSRGHRIMQMGGMGFPAPEEDGQHRYASSGQSITCFGGEGQLSCFDPYTESSDDFSLIQIGLLKHISIPPMPPIFPWGVNYYQSVEAGWQEYEDLTGDWVPHLFTCFTTNGYSDPGDNKGGYNTDVDGWVQYDDTIFPGMTFTPYSTRGGDQYKIAIKYQLYQGNWWLACQGRWVGYYPGSLFGYQIPLFGGMTMLGDHADWIGFWGEIFDSEDVPGRTSSDMGSGYFPDKGWTWSAYMHNLLVQTNIYGAMADYDGSADLYVTDPDMYDIETHFKSGSGWKSYLYLGGPGAR
jgi:hypothetical protein